MYLIFNLKKRIFLRALVKKHISCLNQKMDPPLKPWICNRVKIKCKKKILPWNVVLDNDVLEIGDIGILVILLVLKQRFLAR